MPTLKSLTHRFSIFCGREFVLIGMKVTSYCFNGGQKPLGLAWGFIKLQKPFPQPRWFMGILGSIIKALVLSMRKTPME